MAKLDLKSARDVALFGLPACYIIGFVSWSLYSLTQGLGFLKLSIPQYLAAGVVGLLALGGSLWAFLRVRFAFPKWRRQRAASERKSRFPRFARARNGCFEWVAESVVVPGVLFAVVMVTGFFGAITARDWPMFGVPLLAGALLTGGMRLLVMVKREPPAAAAATEANATFALASIGLVLLFWLFATTYLPAIEPEYGGAKPRHAYFEMDPMALSHETRQALFSPESEGTAENVRRTRNLTVLVTAEDSFLVRTVGNDSAKDPLYEVLRAQVRAIVWID